MVRSTLLFGAALALIAFSAPAKTVYEDPRLPSADDSAARVEFSVPGAKAVVDTTYLLGGPGSWDGSFESPGGQPDWHGWTSEDISISPDNHWHVSTYMADHIPGHGPGNHAMYCGDETIPACSASDTIGGYGNGWFEEIEWRQTVPDPAQPVTLRLTGAMNWDTEEGYDYVYLILQDGDTPQVVETWQGIGSVALDITTVVSPGSFTGPGLDEVRLAWRFKSDSSFSDIDCLRPSRGACQIDDLTVSFNGSAVTFDDFEPGSAVNWNQGTLPGVGDYANLRSNLNSVHSCQSENSSYQVNFVDDGIVVPGTGGTPCIDWCYGPDGWILNHDGGLMADLGIDAHLHNQVVSPPLSWPGNMDGARLSFDLFIHEPFNGSSSGMFGEWNVRSTASADPEDLQNAPWVNRNTILENSAGSYRRGEELVGDLLVPERQWVQIALGVTEFGFHFGINGPNGTPSPYIDNVAFQVWDPMGPDIEVRRNHLLGDAFPEAGILDPDNLAANWCRVDMNDLIWNGARGDSLVALITPLRRGATVVEPPMMHWVMKCNPVFDSARSMPPDPQGILRGATDGSVAVGFNGQPIYGEWAFDLADTGFFFPGDRIHYYVTAGDDLDGDVRTSVWPPDTTGVLDFSLPSVYPYPAEIRGLPTVTQPAPGQFAHPAMLLVDDTYPKSELRSQWLETLETLGISQGPDLEILTVFATDDLSVLVNSGLLSGYDTMIYVAGITSSLEGGGPAEVISWLDQGGKIGLFVGENLVAQLNGSINGDGSILKNRLGVQIHDNNITDRNGGIWDLLVSPVPGNGVLPDDITWQVNVACPQIIWVDAVSQLGPGESAAALDAVGNPSGQYASVVTVDDQTLGNRMAVMPFNLDVVGGMSIGSGRTDKSYSPETYLVYFLMSWLGADVVSGTDDVPGAGRVSVTAHPNPFNPTTTIAFDLPRAMEVSLDIFDLQGRLVRRLVDENPYPQGRHQQVWDGRTGGGQATSSGVYFYRFEAGDQKRVGKLTLLK